VIRFLAVGLGAALLLVGCAAPRGPVDPPSTAEARAFLGDIVAIARSGDLTRLCELGTGNCAKWARELGPASIPPTPPTVVREQVVPARLLPGTDTRTAAGVLFEVCGTDGLGEPYRSEVFVFVDDSSGELRAIEPVYWWRGRVTDPLAPVEGADPRPSGCP
jgi:hypothetical protein